MEEHRETGTVWQPNNLFLRTSLLTQRTNLHLWYILGFTEWELAECSHSIFSSASQTIVTFMSSVASPVEGSVSSFVQPVDSDLVFQTFPQPTQIACLNKHTEAKSLNKNYVIKLKDGFVIPQKEVSDTEGGSCVEKRRHNH